MVHWERLGTVPVERLTAARLQLHWAAQAVAAVGKLLLPHHDDFSEQSFAWCESAAALAQGVVAAPTPFRAALRPSPPALLLLGEGESPPALTELALDGRTFEELYDALTVQVEILLGRPLPAPLARPDALPEHPLGMGGRFDVSDADAFAELGRLFGNAHRLLAAATAAHPGVTEVRLWPHHFDIATLIQLDPPGTDPMKARTIGAGLSPGDGERQGPYLYVTPWPYPASDALPPLPSGGVWHTAGWTGAVLEAPHLLSGKMTGEQLANAERFLASAIDACCKLLET